MRFQIKHEIKGRLRVHVIRKRMSFSQADTLQYYLMGLTGVQKVKVQNRTCDAIIEYDGDRGEILKELQRFSYQQTEVPADYLKNSGREMNQYYWDKLVNRVILHYGTKLFLPISVRDVIATVKSVKYVCEGVRTLLKGMIEVPVLDGTAIGVSVFRGDYSTASSVMFLLGIGEILEEWTHKKSVEDLARSMSLNISKVWLIREGKEELTELTAVNSGDRVVVHMGNVIPFDGDVVAGEAMVNQASLTGESNPVRKIEGGYAYAGTVVEEGEITICVKEVNGSSKYEKIMTMIEDSEKLKSSLEGRAAHLADRLVPYTFAGTGLVWLLTRNTTKALSVLMVDFSCALKLAMPLTVLSAIREASTYDITVKGGKYLEAMAEADTIVFDKTGTLTKAQPTVVDVVSFNGQSSDELLRIAACLEEHFPHSMAKAVVEKAVERNLVHEELHSKVEYIVAHGIYSTIEGKEVVIGSHHFVFEDEHAVIPEGKQELFDQLPEQYSHLYMAIEGKLAAVICIEDPLRKEAPEVIRRLKQCGISKVVMMTGDSDRIASTIAHKVGVDEYYSEVLPEDKAKFVENEKKSGRRVIMIGDGINDSPALSEASVGIAISDGAEIAREIADVTISADDLYEIATLKRLSDAMVRRINKNYHMIVGINTGLILLGVAGVFQPTMSALLHNTSTILISLKSMENLLDTGTKL
ncbi:heavy metal translocating P-type ATPase [Roseburia sp. AM59-24XD]|jgi:heavy metal translocating P-type ATPase|uniref:heavy metal translocating P-type ATPase n=1 Tax=Roseburia sp. AM59-24XD TaxID=2293138 RepID=UPI000E470E72|nr:heavy metal translocating P-type ATPase [Roseburia sp. AM59-24XD]RHP79677.1 heavy metal translocating P-type ATPase [Roseburia sp. AM59-24XD]